MCSCRAKLCDGCDRGKHLERCASNTQPAQPRARWINGQFWPSLFGWQPSFPMTIKMECGSTKTFNKSSEFHYDSIKCPCGHPDCWFIP